MRYLQIVSLLILLFPLSLFAQICDFSHQTNAHIERYTEGAVAQFFQNPIRQRAVARIPVVVHVVWNDLAQNISDAQIQSQIEALNRDFRKRNTVNSAFARFAVDCEIEFCLATRDTNGVATKGIERRQTNIAEIGSTFQDTFRRIYYNSRGGLNAWNPQKYFNIWVCAFTPSAGTLGFATSLAKVAARPQEDGIIVDYRVFGTIGNLLTDRQNGRIAVHEVGHYFNLLHIWGSDDTCNDDDAVEDTPLQASPHIDCPVDLIKSCTTAFDFYRNYMDLTNDDCTSFFTAGQKARMWATLTGFRSGLLNSNACEPVGVTHIYMPTFEAYPNPAESVLTVALKNWNSSAPKKIRLMNCFGRIVSEKTLYTEGGVDLPLDGLASGFYCLSLSVDNEVFIKKIVIQK